jgi:hypothetical protein
VRIGAVLLLFAAGVAAEEHRLTWKADGIRLADAAARVEEEFGIRVELGDDVLDKWIDVAFDGVTATQALRRLRDWAGAALTRVGEKHYLLGRDRRMEILAQLDGSRVPLYARRQPSYLMYRLSRGVSGIACAVDSVVDDGRLDIDHNLGVSGREYLDILARETKATWEVRCGVVILTTAERLALIPRHSPFRELVTGSEAKYRIRAQPLQQALEQVVRNARTKIRYAVQIPDVRVTLCGSMTPADAFAVLLLPHGLTLETDGDGDRAVVRLAAK